MAGGVEVMETPILKIELQRTKKDCGIAVLAMLLEFTYEEVLIATARVAPTIFTLGMTTRQLRLIAKRLGYSAIRQLRIDLSTATGALVVRSNKWPDDHMVVLRDELIIETDGTLWDADIFMSYYKAVPTHLFVFEKLV